MKLEYVLIIIAMIVIVLTGCGSKISKQDKERKGDENINGEPVPEILVDTEAKKINFVFGDDEIGIERFDGEYINIHTWDNYDKAVIDMEGNFIVPWQKGRLDIYKICGDIFEITYYVNIIDEELDGEGDVGVEYKYNYYKKDEGFIFDEMQTEPMTEAQLCELSGMKEKIEDKEYEKFFTDFYRVDVNNTGKGIAYQDKTIGLYDLTNGEKIKDLDYDIYIDYEVYDNYYTKDISDANHDHVMEIYDFNDNHLATFSEPHKSYRSNTGILYEYENDVYYLSIE